MSHPTVSSTPKPAKKPGLIAEMLRLWLEHNQRILDMRTGPF